MSLFKFLIDHIFLSHVLGDFCITIWIIQNVFQKKSPIEHNVEHLYWKRTYLKDVCESGKSFFIDKRRSKRLWMIVQGIGFKFELSQWIDDSRNWMGLDEERQVFFVNFSLRNYHRYSGRSLF